MQMKQRLMKLTTLTVVNVEDTVKKKTTEANPMTQLRWIWWRVISNGGFSNRFDIYWKSIKFRAWGIIPKFHYKLNFIERIWGNCKATLRRCGTFRFDDLQRIQPETCQCSTTAFLQASCKILFQMDVRLLWRPDVTISWCHNEEIHDSSLHLEIRRSTRPASGVRAIVCMV